MTLSHIHIDVTSRCNLSCEHCFFFEDSASPLQRAEPSIAQIGDWIEQAKELGCRHVTFSGGEPFLRDDMVELLALGGVPKTILTNGSLISPSLLRALDGSGDLQELRVSWDGFAGHRQLRGDKSLQDVLDLFRRIDLETSLPYAINTTLTAQAVPELQRMYDYVQSSGAYMWRIDLPFLRGRYKKNVASLEPDLHAVFQAVRSIVQQHVETQSDLSLQVFGVFKSEMLSGDIVRFDANMHPCEYYRGSVTVHCDGSVGLCPTLPLVFGNLGVRSLRDILAGDEFMSFWVFKVSDIPECAACDELPLCGGGCRADSLFVGNGLEGLDERSCRQMRLRRTYFSELPSGLCPAVGIGGPPETP